VEISLKHFYFANHSQKQEKTKTFLMLSTIITPLTVCNGNHTSASARMVLPVSGSLKGFVTLAKQNNPGIVFMYPFLHSEVLISKSVVPEIQKILDETIKMANHIKSRPLQSRLFSALCSVMGPDSGCN
jgi:hypothetical protein